MPSFPSNKKKYWERPSEQRKSKKPDKFYTRKDWRRLRSVFLRKNPLCEHCRQDGKLVQAQIVDHIKPRAVAPELSVDWHNLQALCWSCHSRKTVKENTSK